MHSSSLFVLLAAGTALAAPSHGINSHGFVSKNSRDVSSISLPTSNLPQPDAALVLKYVALGVGTQNYSCSTTPGDMSAAPASVGAVADLYDATPVLSVDAGMVKSLPAVALQMLQMQTKPSDLPAPMTMPLIGKHFFAAGLVPNFVLSGANPMANIAAKKVANVPAPTGSCPGEAGAGAVDWLQLIDNGLGVTSTALSGGDVYRVETAGGNPPATCVDTTGDVQSQYAALYYFYGKM